MPVALLNTASLVLKMFLCLVFLLSDIKNLQLVSHKRRGKIVFPMLNE